ncbi:hypothetical protein EV360DRAFT_76032, partial [Lentinula raphanica]
SKKKIRANLNELHQCSLSFPAPSTTVTLSNSGSVNAQLLLVGVIMPIIFEVPFLCPSIIHVIFIICQNVVASAILIKVPNLVASCYAENTNSKSRKWHEFCRWRTKFTLGIGVLFGVGIASVLAAPISHHGAIRVVARDSPPSLVLEQNTSLDGPLDVDENSLARRASSGKFPASDSESEDDGSFYTPSYLVQSDSPEVQSGSSPKPSNHKSSTKEVPDRSPPGIHIPTSRFSESKGKTIAKDNSPKSPASESDDGGSFYTPSVFGGNTDSDDDARFHSTPGSPVRSHSHDPLSTENLQINDLPDGLRSRLKLLRATLESNMDNRIYFNSVVEIYSDAITHSHDRGGLHPEKCTEKFLEQIKKLSTADQLKMLYLNILPLSIEGKKRWTPLIEAVPVENRPQLMPVVDWMKMLDSFFQEVCAESASLGRAKHDESGRYWKYECVAAPSSDHGTGQVEKLLDFK